MVIGLYSLLTSFCMISAGARLSNLVTERTQRPPTSIHVVQGRSGDKTAALAFRSVHSIEVDINESKSARWWTMPLFV